MSSTEVSTSSDGADVIGMSSVDPHADILIGGSDIETGKSADDTPRSSSPLHKRPPSHKRSKSLGDIHESSDKQSYLYSFRLPHDFNSANNDDASVATVVDYNLVLDEYIEYADDTKIPRLKGKDVHPLLAAIHSSHWAVLCITVTVSCVLTYSISNYSPFLRADMSQALVITIVLATFPEAAASSGAGAFAGMASSKSIPNYGWLALLCLIVSAVWFLFHRFKVLVGCGGRLGTCAFISMNMTVAIFAMPSQAVPWSLYFDAGQLWSERLELVPSILVVVACSFLSAVGGAVRLQSKIPLNPVLAPTTIALLCMLILEPTGFVYTEQVDAGLAVGSFVAMASEQYLPTVLDFAAAGFLAGLWILFLDPFFLGFGGKKGFTSFCGFATYVALSRWTCRRTSSAKEK